MLLKFHGGLLPLKPCRDVRAALQAREKKATREIPKREARLNREKQQLEKQFAQDFRPVQKKIDDYNRDRERILLPKLNKYKRECEGKTLPEEAFQKCMALLAEYNSLNEKFFQRKAQVEVERDAATAKFEAKWAVTIARLKKEEEDLKAAKEARDKDRELLKTAPPCANKKATDLAIQVSPGPVVVAGGAAVDLTAVPTPEDADTKFTWSPHPTGLGSLSPRTGKTTKFKPGKKPGMVSIIVRDSISGKQAFASLEVHSESEFEICDLTFQFVDPATKTGTCHYICRVSRTEEVITGLRVFPDGSIKCAKSTLKRLR